MDEKICSVHKICHCIIILYVNTRIFMTKKLILCCSRSSFVFYRMQWLKTLSWRGLVLDNCLRRAIVSRFLSLSFILCNAFWCSKYTYETNSVISWKNNRQGSNHCLVATNCRPIWNLRIEWVRFSRWAKLVLSDEEEQVESYLNGHCERGLWVNSVL